MSVAEKRASRAPPPLPIASPTMAPHGDARPPPPPPPTAAPPSRSSTTERNVAGMPAEDDEESEYEGDYDTDIGSGVPHKDALRSHARDSIDESTFSEDASLASPVQSRPPPPPLPSGPRNVPPPPPPHTISKSNRQSTDPGHAPRPAPSRDIDDGDYDPYRYPTSIAAAPTKTPFVSSNVQQESDPSLYSPAPSAGQPSVISSPPLTGFNAAQIHNVPPPLPPQHQNLPMASGSTADDTRKSREAPRKSLDVPRQSITTSRRSMEQSRPSMDQGQFARDLDMAQNSLWWTQGNNPPPALQGRSDILCEFEESSSSKRGGRNTIARDVYVLYPDYSQSTITARFDSKDPNDVSFEQRHEPPPARPRQDQLEQAHERYGPNMFTAASSKANSSVGDGSAQSLVHTLIAALPAALLPIGTRAYGALVYANLANATVQQHDEIRPGDIISFRNAKFQGKHGAMHQKYSEDIGKPDHVAIVAEWDGTKKKVRAWEQGREKAGKVKVESFKLGDLRSGEVKIWRVMGREWIGWDAGS